MELSQKSYKQIFKYLLSTEALKNDPPESIAQHVERLEKWGQLEAEEDIEGDLVYAVGWWKLTDVALEDLKKGTSPKRFNRGRNIVGFFWLIPKQDLGIMQMRRIIKRVARMERAKSLHIFTSRDKWFSVRFKPSSTPWQRMKRRRAEEVINLIGGNRAASSRFGDSRSRASR